jgi:hypothetical protein
LASHQGNSVAAASSSTRKSTSKSYRPLWVRFFSSDNLFLILTARARPSETSPAERPQLFLRKLNQCRVLFDFNDASSELKGKQIKAQTLHEMLEYITTQRGVITDNVYPEVVSMVCSSSSLLRLWLTMFLVRDQLVPFDTPSDQSRW